MFRIAAILLLLGTGAFFAGFSMLVPAFVEPVVQGRPVPWLSILADQPLGVVLLLCGPVSWGVIARLLTVARRRREAEEG